MSLRIPRSLCEADTVRTHKDVNGERDVRRAKGKSERNERESPKKMDLSIVYINGEIMILR